MGGFKLSAALVVRHLTEVWRLPEASGKLSVFVQRLAMKAQLLTMLEMQDAMNARVNPDWRQAGNAWYRAIWTECAEMLDHYGWKWWKHQQPDLEQVQLELVDILHFAMSDYLLQDTDSDIVAARIEAELKDPRHNDDIRAAIENMAQTTIASKSMHFSDFANVMALIPMDFDQLYRTYVGKNVLNFFRQDHGYQEGSYVKTWDGREDNEHLVEVLGELDSRSADFRDEIYRGLGDRYPG